ncbi:hypothetical protein [Halogeometricum rufum]|uniref:hypothetical protein n=1 Tax=Halogeometricum rufum TaxID=553469 RepID=UPI001160408E|nr:hypothetical protein [Halogeometricum rufum]
MSQIDVDERLAELTERLDALEEENAELREELHEKDQRIERIEENNQWLTQYVAGLEEEVFGDWTAGTLLAELGGDSLGDVVADLVDDVEAVHDTATQETLERKVGLLRSEHGAMLRKLAEESGVDLGITHGDIITKVREEGIDSAGIGHRVYKKHRRAEIVLSNIEDWGKTRTVNGITTYRLERPDVRRFLNSQPDVDITLQSKNVGDVFDAIEELAEGSPRYVSRRKEDGTDTLYVGWITNRGESQ